MDRLSENRPATLQLSPLQWKKMLADVRARAPQEACGLVAGLENTCLAVYPLSNILHSPTSYQIDPQEQFDTFQLIEAKGWDLLAIYHSHPMGPPGLSPRDIAEAFYPQVIYLVWYPTGEMWDCKGFLVLKPAPQEIELLVIPEEES
jgi:proteasome lid subunit RPN8/RPN11